MDRVRGLGVAVTATLIALLAAAPTSAAVSSGGYTVRGNEIVAPSGGQFIPRGFVVYCLALTDLKCEQPTPDDPNTDPARIRAAATFWHADVIRFQVAEEQLFDTAPYDAGYLAQLDSEVTLANRLGMVAIITLQEEEFNGPPLPTASAVRFWQFMAPHYANNPMVFFDLYNEPRLKPLEGEASMWNIWRNGGSAVVAKTDMQFVGMQTLVDDIRSLGANNVIVAEGNQGDHDLSLLPEYLLSGPGITYGIEPDLLPTDQSPAQWSANFGALSERVPLVMAALQDYPTVSACNPDSPTLLPQLLDYLQGRHLGLIAYSLEAGNLIVGDNLDQPTTFQGVSTYQCVLSTPAKTKAAKKKLNNAEEARLNANPALAREGPGADILAFFGGHSPSPSSSRATWLIAALVVLVAGIVAIGLLAHRHRSRRRPRQV